MQIAVMHQAVNTNALSPRTQCKGFIEVWQHDGTSGSSLKVGFEFSTEKLQLGLLDFLSAQLVSTEPGTQLRDTGLFALPSEPTFKWV